jgi:hypothetical protein
MSTNEIEASIDRYAAAAAAHGEASERGDHKRANREFNVISGVYRGLRAKGPEAQSRLLRLLDHPNAAVRGWAASHALEFSSGAGEKVLQALIKDGGLPGFNAEMVLQEWRSGSLTFP